MYSNRYEHNCFKSFLKKNLIFFFKFNLFTFLVLMLHYFDYSNVPHIQVIFLSSIANLPKTSPNLNFCSMKIAHSMTYLKWFLCTGLQKIMLLEWSTKTNAYKNEPPNMIWTNCTNNVLVCGSKVLTKLVVDCNIWIELPFFVEYKLTILTLFLCNIIFALSLAFDIKWGKKIRDEMQAENSFINWDYYFPMGIALFSR